MQTEAISKPIADLASRLQLAMVANSNRLLTIGQVCEMTTLGETTIDRLETEGKFPKRIERQLIGVRARLYTLRSVEKWMRDIDPNPTDQDED